MVRIKSVRESRAGGVSVLALSSRFDGPAFSARSLFAGSSFSTRSVESF